MVFILDELLFLSHGIELLAVLDRCGFEPSLKFLSRFLRSFDLLVFFQNHFFDSFLFLYFNLATLNLALSVHQQLLKFPDPGFFLVDDCFFVAQDSLQVLIFFDDCILEQLCLFKCLSVINFSLLNLVSQSLSWLIVLVQICLESNKFCLDVFCDGKFFI